MKFEDIEFEDYKRKYEFVFFRKQDWPIERVLKDIVIDDGTTEIEAFAKQMKDTYQDFETAAFDWIVKAEWLRLRFSFRGLKHQYGKPVACFLLSYSYSMFIKRMAGFDSRFFGDDYFLSHIKSYLKDLIPDLPSRNPFKEKIKYPFKYMNLECLHLVFKMPERLDLIKIGEQKKMSYLEFLDYMVNYINCYNEEHGKRYVFKYHGDKLCNRQKYIKVI